jgi:hypothetical protein
MVSFRRAFSESEIENRNHTTATIDAARGGTEIKKSTPFSPLHYALKEYGQNKR